MRIAPVSCRASIAILLAAPLASQAAESSAMTNPSSSGGTRYVVAAEQSSVNILVYRTGALALFGHDHVMTVDGLSGNVWVDAGRSGFDLAFPVAQLVVDDPAARKTAGRDFASEVSQGDRAGTRHNMLLPEVLDGAHYPQITLHGSQMSGALPDVQFVVQVQIKDVTRSITIPANVTIDGQTLTAQGQFEIVQSDFGIKPFKVALGALEVRDRLVVKFEVVAKES